MHETACSLAVGADGTSCSLALAEAYYTLATLFGRFDVELYGFDYSRDFALCRDMFQGFPSRESKGIRVKVLRELQSDSL